MILVTGFVTPSDRRNSPPEDNFNRMQTEHCFSLPKVGVPLPFCSLFASGELMFYRSSRDGLICLGVAFTLMCNRQMLDVEEDKAASFVSQGASGLISQVIH